MFPITPSWVSEVSMQRVLVHQCDQRWMGLHVGIIVWAPRCKDWRSQTSIGMHEWVYSFVWACSTPSNTMIVWFHLFGLGYLSLVFCATAVETRVCLCTLMFVCLLHRWWWWLTEWWWYVNVQAEKLVYVISNQTLQSHRFASMAILTRPIWVMGQLAESIPSVWAFDAFPETLSSQNTRIQEYQLTPFSPTHEHNKLTVQFTRWLTMPAWAMASSISHIHQQH